MFRSVTLPEDVPGRLVLHRMPGFQESLEECLEALRDEGIQRIVCLAGPEELLSRSPDYASAIESNTLPVTVTCFPIEEFGIPEDGDAFRSLALEIADQLRAGTGVLIHCGMGIGRTGTLAVCVLLALGATLAEAELAVAAAGSHPETAEQRALVKQCESHNAEQ